MDGTTTMLMPEAGHRTRARLSAAVLVYYIGVILLITLVPFHFVEVGRFRVLWTGGIVDVLANVAFFLPVGFLYPLSRAGSVGRRIAGAVLFGTLLSMTIELAQLFEPARYTSVVDVAANAAGTVAGAAIFAAAARRLARGGRLTGRLSLELPLMGGLYLLLPLLWLSSMSLAGDWARWLMPTLLCLFGGRLWAVLQRFHFGPLAGVSAWQMRFVAAAWAALGLAPAAGHPLPVLGLAVLTAACVGRVSRPVGSADRRFEAAALVYALPMFLAYLAALALLPGLTATGPWRGVIGFAATAHALSTIGQLRSLEVIAAASVLGYLLAEMVGRRELPYRQTAPWLAAATAGFAVAVEVIRGLDPGLGASAAELLLIALAGPYGGWIYHLQRRHIRAVSAEEARSAGFPIGGAPASPEGQGSARERELAQQLSA